MAAKSIPAAEGASRRDRVFAWPGKGGLVGPLESSPRPVRLVSDLLMAPRKPKVVVTRKLPDAVETRMRELFDTELKLDDAAMSSAEQIGRAHV